MKSYYMIDFSASACHFTILVNDIPVMEYEVKGQVSTSIPINLAILESGKQEVSIRLQPLSGETKVAEEADFNYKIYLFDVSNGSFDYQKELPGTSDIMADPKSLKSPFIVTFTNVFQAEVPYKLDGWKNGKLLKDYKDETIRAKLKDIYQKISTVISKRDYAVFKQMIAEREKIMAVSMYLDEAAKISRVDDLINDFESGFKMKPFSDDVILFLYGYGKTAAFKNIKGESALQFYNEKTNEVLMLDLMFYIPKEKDSFEII